MGKNLGGGVLSIWGQMGGEGRDGSCAELRLCRFFESMCAVVVMCKRRPRAPVRARRADQSAHELAVM
mgnify:CR=1 FL=1